MKLCVLGGAGARSAFLTKSLAVSAASIGVDELVLMDTEEQHLKTYGAIAVEIASRIDPNLRCSVTKDATEALTNADYIITTIRAGGDAGRVFDERTCLERGVLGQETTGAGGFAMALRSVPTLLSYCALARRVARKNHLIFNFTNPSGIITQAMRSQGYDNVYGICDAPSGFIRQLEAILGVADGELDIDCYGLNHYSFFRNARVHDRDVQRELLETPDTFTRSEMRLFTPEQVALNDGCLLNEYLYFYFSRARSQELLQKAKETRGETIYRINRALEEKLNALSLPKEIDQAFSLYMHAYAERENAYFSIESGQRREKVWVPPTLSEFIASPDEGGYAAVALRFIRAITRAENCRMVLSVPNNGAITGLADDDVVEITCAIDREGAHPIPIGEIGAFQLQQLQRIKSFERGTIRAILERSEQEAARALYLHPLVNDLEIASDLASKFFQQYARYLELDLN